MIEFCCGEKPVNSFSINQTIINTNLKILASAQASDFLLLKPNVFVKLFLSNYNELLAECQRTKQNFIDKEFPHNNKSLEFSVPNREIVWRRITDVIEGCVMVESIIEPGDILQGNGGDCYFLASLAALAQFESKGDGKKARQTISSIFGGPDKMVVNPYGIYKLIISDGGSTRQVVIDDYLPFFADTSKPVFCKPNGKQIWVLLLEKAWAKLRGSYGKTVSGYPHTVLNTFSAAPCFNIEIQPDLSQQSQNKIWSELLEATKQFPMVAGSKSQTSKGIKPSHAYTVLGAYNVIGPKGKQRLIRMRNPWGHDEYTGKFSQSDLAFWKEVKPEVRASILEKNSENDGIFIIPFQSFLDEFASLDICTEHEGFFADMEPITMIQNQARLFIFTINTETKVYLSIQKPINLRVSEGHKQKQEENIDPGYFRMLVAKKVGQNFEFIQSKLETAFPDLTTSLGFLKPGNYVIYVQGNNHSAEGIEFHATISSYCSNFVDLKPAAGFEVANFLSKVFTSHAQRVNTNKKKIGAHKNDWVCAQLLDTEGGFGYMAVNIQKDSHSKISLDIDEDLIKENGFILEDWEGKQMKKTIGAGQNEIVVFTINLTNGLPTEGLNFPPPGCKLNKVITH